MNHLLSCQNLISVPCLPSYPNSGLGPVHHGKHEMAWTVDSKCRCNQNKGCVRWEQVSLKCLRAHPGKKSIKGQISSHPAQIWKIWISGMSCTPMVSLFHLFSPTADADSRQHQSRRISSWEQLKLQSIICITIQITKYNLLYTLFPLQHYTLAIG